MKRTNRIQMRINSLRQMSNSRWKQFSLAYARVLVRFPWSILAISALLTAVLTVCLVFLGQTRPFDQSDFLMPHGPAIRNALHIRRIFGNDTELRMHQQLDLYPGLDIIMKRKQNDTQGDDNETNMLRNEIIDEIHLLNERIRSIRITSENNSMTYNYSSLCTKVNHACIVDGNYILTDRFRQELFHLLPPKFGYYFDDSGANGIPGFMFGSDYLLTNVSPPVVVADYEEEEDEEDAEVKGSTSTVPTPAEQIISYAPLLRLRYSLNTSTPEMRQLAILWERRALRYLNDEYQSSLIDVFPSTSKAITDAIVSKAHEEGLYMSLMILVFLFLVCFFLTIQGNCHTSVAYLPLCGMVSIALSTGATFGVLSLCGIQIIEPMALLVFVVAIVDCMRMSIVCGEYHRIVKNYLVTITDASSEIDIEKLLSLIIQCTHPYFLISTLIIIMVYSLFSVLSPMLTTTLICLTLVLYILVNYCVHATFFTSCLAITLKRLSARRHSFLCFRLSNDHHARTIQETSQSNSLKNRLAALWNVDSVVKKFLAALLCLVLIVSIISGIWFTLSIDTRLFDDKFLPRDASSLRSYMKSQADDFDIGPMVIFTIPEAVNYENTQIRSAIKSLLEQCHKETRTNDFQLLWLDHENVHDITTGRDPLHLRVTPFSQNDLVVFDRGNSSTIIASRFYCQLVSVKGDREDIRTMNNLYTHASQSPIPSVFPYSLLFSTYESLEQIRTEMYLLILLLIVCSFVSTLIPMVSLKSTLLVVSHLLALLTSTLACLYLFHSLTFDFANALWLYVVSIIFLDTLMHACYTRSNSTWQYNRIILALMLSLLVLYFFPVQSYVFQIIRNSLIYQSGICLLLINIVLPSCAYLFPSVHRTDAAITKVQQPMVTIIDANQSLTDGVEIKNGLYETDMNRHSAI